MRLGVWENGRRNALLGREDDELDMTVGMGREDDGGNSLLTSSRMLHFKSTTDYPIDSDTEVLGVKMAWSAISCAG